MPLKAGPADILGRFREVISDPLNLLIERVPMAGFVDKVGILGREEITQRRPADI